MTQTAQTPPRDQLFVESLKQEHRALPYALWDRMREEPVSRQGDGIWVVSGYEHVRGLLADPRLSSDWERLAEQGHEDQLPFIFTDPPRHESLRRHVMRHFGPPTHPRLVSDYEELATRMATEELDGLRGRTRCDVVGDYTSRLPVAIICRLVGVPIEDQQLFHGWIDPVLDVFGNPDPTPEQQKADHEASAALAEYLLDIVRSRRSRPQDDLISTMLQDDTDGDLSDTEVVKAATLLFIAGHVTTVNSTTSTILQMLRTPEATQRVRDDLSLVPAAFEEGLRTAGPLHFVLRVALADIPVGDAVIPQGADVRLHLGAADRDPLRFPDPGAFDPLRRDNQHLAFNGGPHFCFGAPLARMEARVLLTEWLRRVEGPRLVVDPPPYRTSPGFVGPKELLVDFDRIVD